MMDDIMAEINGKRVTRPLELSVNFFLTASWKRDNSPKTFAFDVTP
jgi:hypothetical protein